MSMPSSVPLAEADLGGAFGYGRGALQTLDEGLGDTFLCLPQLGDQRPRSHMQNAEGTNTFICRADDQAGEMRGSRTIFSQLLIASMSSFLTGLVLGSHLCLSL